MDSLLIPACGECSGHNMSVREFLTFWIEYLFSPLSSSSLCPLDLKTLIIKENVSTHMTVGNMATGTFTKNVAFRLHMT